MKKILYALAALLALSMPVLAQSTKAQLNTEVSNNYPDNTTGLITPQILRTVTNDQISSWQQAPRVNAQVGTTYTFAIGDYGYLVTFSNSSPVAVVLPQATSTFATFNVMACNKNTGAVTITPSVSTIGGAATKVLQNGQCAFVVSDSTNYQIADGISLQAVTCAASNWINAILATGVPQCAQPAASDLSNGVTGSGAVVLANTPTLITPVLGVATATSINKVAITAPAASATLTIANTKTLTASNTLTFAGTDGSTLNIGTGGTLGTAAFQNTGTSGANVPLLNGGNTYSGSANFTSMFQINGNTQTFPGAAATLTQTIASGASAMGTSAIGSAACATVVTATATGTATTDVIAAVFNGDPTAVTGYVPSTSGMLTIFVYPTLNNVNFKVCNNTAGSITPGAITLNWRVVR